MAAKTVNYTPEMTAELVEAYKAAPTAETVETFSTKFGKTVKSVVAKLSKEGVYVKAEYKTKTGAKPVSKEALVSELASLVGRDEEFMGSLEKANKNVLEVLVAAFGKPEFDREIEDAGEFTPDRG